MAYVITSQDIQLLKQAETEYYAKLELLDFNKKVIDVLESHLISDSLSKDATSDVRTTYSCKVFCDSEKEYFTNPLSFIDKYLCPYIGYKHIRTGEIVWYKVGTFIVLKNGHTYDSTTNELSLTCSSLISTLNGERGGTYHGTQTITVEQGQNARTSIIGLLNNVGITSYIINDIGSRTIPYDQVWNAGDSYYKMITDILNLYSGYEMFFNEDGVLIIQRIPTLVDDPIVLDDYVLKECEVSESSDVDYTNVYNYVEIWGQQIETDYTATGTATYSGGIYSASITGVTSYVNYKRYAVTIGVTNIANSQLNINSLGARYICNDDGSRIPISTLPLGMNVFEYRADKNDFYWLGQFQVHVTKSETSGISPFSISKIGVVPKVCSGGDYDNIYSQSLAEERANYELYNGTMLQMSVNLEMVNIPFLNVNTKIAYTNDRDGVTRQFIVKSISSDTASGMMSVGAIEFIPQYYETL